MMEVTPVAARTWSRLGQRGAIFGIALPEMAKKKDNLLVLTADLGFLSGLDRFKSLFPDKLINVGVAEQNMIGIAAGLAKEGNCAVATTYATFITMRCFEQIRNNLGYMGFNVKLVGSAAGLAAGMMGSTHYALEDIALMRSVPNITILSPADGTEAVKMFCAMLEMDCPAYMRLTGELNCPVIYKSEYDFEIGKGVVLREGFDAAIVATGVLVNEALIAADKLRDSAISCTVVDMHTIKPLDAQLLDRLFESHKLIVTVEEHHVTGGLGSAVAEYKAASDSSRPQLIIGVPDCFPHAADYSDLLERFGLTAQGIAGRIKDKLAGI